MTHSITRRGALTLGLGTVAAAGLTACGSSTPGQSAKTPEASTAGASSAATTTTIQFWHRTFTPAENKWYKDIVAKFNAAQTAVKVVDTEIPGDAWDEKMKAAQSAGKAPDIYTHPGAIQDGVRLGQLHELDSLMPKEKLAEIVKEALPVSQLGGKYYAYPLLLEPQSVLFWNKDMFKAAGLDPEAPPKSWEELFSYCEKIKPTLQPGQFCISPAADQVTFAWSSVGQQMNFAGHTALSSDWTKPTVVDDGYKQLITAYKTMYEKGYMPKQALAPYVEGKDYGQKKVAMKVSGSWMMSELGTDYPDLLTKTGVAPLMARGGDQTKPTSTLGNFKWVIDAKAAQPKAAAAFLAWALAGDPALLVPFFVDTQFTKVPARKSVADAVAKDPKAGQAPWSKAIAEKIAPYAIPEPSYPWDVSMAVGLAIEKGMKGAATVDAALAEADATIAKVIQQNNLPAIAPKN